MLSGTWPYSPASASYCSSVVRDCRSISGRTTSRVCGTNVTRTGFAFIACAMARNSCIRRWCPLCTPSKLPMVIAIGSVAEKVVTNSIVSLLDYPYFLWLIVPQPQITGNKIYEEPLPGRCWHPFPSTSPIDKGRFLGRTRRDAAFVKLPRSFLKKTYPYERRPRPYALGAAQPAAVDASIPSLPFRHPCPYAIREAALNTFLGCQAWR